MTYRQAFDQLGQPRAQALRLRYRQALLRWLLVAASIMVWALLTRWMDGAP